MRQLKPTKTLYTALIVVIILLTQTPLVISPYYGFIGPALRFEVSAPREVKVNTPFTIDLAFTVANYDLYNVTIEVSLKGAGIMKNLKIVKEQFIPAGNFTVLSLTLTPLREGTISLGIIASYDYLRGNITNHESAVIWIDISNVASKLKSEIEDELANLKKTASELTAKLITLNSSYNELLSEYEKIEEENKILKENITELRENCSELVNQLEVVNSKLTVIEDSLNRAQNAMYMFMTSTVILAACTGFFAALSIERIRRALKKA